MTLALQAVNNSAQFRDFVNLPWDLYGKNPDWIPPLKITVKDYLDQRKNPFYQHSQLQLWLVYDGQRPVGRIAGIVNRKHNEFHQEKVVFWGFFESTENQQVSQLLFDAVRQWGAQHGMLVLRGPMSPSTNHECGLQISAFDTAPYFMMPMNPEYYRHFAENFGFRKAKDLFAWHAYVTGRTADARIATIANKQIAKKRYTVRSLNMKDFANEIERIFEIYNDAWEKNWGFIPMSRDEFKHMAKELKAIINPKLCLLVEVDQEPVGFSLTVPNLNQVTKNIRDGKLLPFGIFKLLWHTKIRPSIDSYRNITLGVKKKYQTAGLASILYIKTEEALREINAKEVECSWILEDNHAMNNALKGLGARLYKIYRLYEMNIQPAG